MIPENFYKYKETPIWENETIPSIILTKHNTKAWSYGKINIISGELEYTVFNNDDSIKSTTVLTPSNHWVAIPQEWHKIKPLWEVKVYVEFYKEKPLDLVKKESQFKFKYDKSPHKEIFKLTELLEHKSDKTALDIGCGLWRNSILLADNLFKVTSVDRNTDALSNISDIAVNDHLDITTHVVDLNTYILDDKYDCIISTVVLQFLENESAINIIKSMKLSTIIWGYNVIIVPIDSQDHLCPIRFSTLLKEWSLKEYYFDWEIIEYNEMMWSFHRKDINWNKIISRFATIIAKKI
jgi:tellurite methyltransferase